MRKQQRRNHDACQQVAQDDLEKTQIARECQRRCADYGQGAGFSGYDGEADGPPGRRPATQKIIAQVGLAAAEMRAEEGDANQVDEDDRQVEITHDNWQRLPAYSSSVMIWESESEPDEAKRCRTIVSFRFVSYQC